MISVPMVTDKEAGMECNNHNIRLTECSIIYEKNSMNNAKKRKVFIICFTGLIALIILGILSGSYERIINLCKAYIYCNSSELPHKTTQNN